MKSNYNGFTQAIKESKPTFREVDHVSSDKQVKSLNKYEDKPKKVQSPLTYIIVYDFETFNKDRAVPFSSGIEKLNNFSGKYHRDITQKENQTCLNDCDVLKGADCVIEMLDCVLSYKREPKKVNIKIIESNIY